jgi:hypothetical protein
METWNTPNGKAPLADVPATKKKSSLKVAEVKPVVAEVKPVVAEVKPKKTKSPRVVKNTVCEDHVANHEHSASRVPSKWVEHVKAEAKKLNLTYGNALKNADVKASYKKVNFTK